MIDVSRALSPLQGFLDFSSFSPPASSTSTGAARLEARTATQTQTQFTILTAQGDRVSLSASSSIDSTLATYTAQGLIEGQAGSLQGTRFNVSTVSTFDLVIEGELNDQERKDIERFIKGSRKLLKEFLRGREKETPGELSNIGELDTLASATFAFTRSVSASITQSSIQTVESPTPSRPEKPSSSGSGREDRRTLEDTLDRLRDLQQTLQLSPNKLAKRLPSLFEKLFDDLEHETGEDEARRGLFKDIRRAVLQSALPSPEASSIFKALPNILDRQKSEEQDFPVNSSEETREDEERSAPRSLAPPDDHHAQG